MADYPKYEIMVTYECVICKGRHVAYGKAVGSALAAELAGGGAVKGQTLVARCLEMAKRNVVKEFFKAHPKAALGDFDLNMLRARETVVHNKDFTDTDTLGVPMVREEVASIMDEMVEEAKGKKVEAKIASEEDKLSGKTIQLEEMEEKAPLDTGSEPSMSFESVQLKVQEELKRLRGERLKLTEQLAKVEKDLANFETLEEAMKGSKKKEKR